MFARLVVMEWWCLRENWAGGAITAVVADEACTPVAAGWGALWVPSALAGGAGTHRDLPTGSVGQAGDSASPSEMLPGSETYPGGISLGGECADALWVPPTPPDGEA